MLIASSLLALLLAGLAVGSLLPDGQATSDDDEDGAAGTPSARAANEGADSSDEQQSPSNEPGADNSIHGSDEADTLTGGSGNDSLSGGDGDDWLKGGTGADTLDGGAGDDDLILSREDIAIGGNGSDSFYIEKVMHADIGKAAPEILDFETGIDRLLLEFDLSEGPLPTLSLDHETAPGDTIVRADAAPMVILRGIQDVTLEDLEVVLTNEPETPQVDSEHDATADAQTGGPGADTISGNTYNNLIFGDEGDDHLTGGAGNDTIHGGAGNDILIGGDGADQLDGGDGDDTIHAGAGDTITGGAGADLVSINALTGNDEDPALVTDFDPAQDAIEILFDPAETPNPVITVIDFADGTGADIMLNDELVLKAVGAQGLSPAAIALVDINTQDPQAA